MGERYKEHIFDDDVMSWAKQSNTKKITKNQLFFAENPLVPMKCENSLCSIEFTSKKNSVLSSDLGSI